MAVIKVEPTRSSLSLAKQDILEVISHIHNPIDTLSLSATCRCLAELIRNAGLWEQALLRDGWDLKPIQRDAHNSSWLGLAKAAIDRHVVETHLPEYLQGSLLLPQEGISTPFYMFQVGDYLRRALWIISQIGEASLVKMDLGS